MYCLKICINYVGDKVNIDMIVFVEFLIEIDFYIEKFLLDSVKLVKR